MESNSIPSGYNRSKTRSMPREGKNYWEDGRCSFTNNFIENVIRSLAVGYENWMFSSLVDGANAVFMMYVFSDFDIIKGSPMN